MEKQDFLRLTDRHEPTRMGTSKVCYIYIELYVSCVYLSHVCLMCMGIGIHYRCMLTVV